jgi:hypothetical protein
MSNKAFHVPVVMLVQAGEVDSIMSTALEGGITYWCCEAVPLDGYMKDQGGECASDVISRGGRLLLKSLEGDHEEDPEKYTLTLDKFLKGLAAYVEVFGVSDGIDCVDADGADRIVQAALFGEQVYG